jgi:cytochrome c oxidase assembly factor CtaG
VPVNARAFRPQCGLAGLAAVALALLGPLDARAHRGIAAHMAQHLLLTGVAGPLLALGAPRLTTRMHGHRWSSYVAAAAATHAGVMVVWHLPAAYDAAVRHAPLHALEHSTLLGTSALMWFVLLGARADRRRGIAALVVFLESLPMTVLGAAMTLASHPWYDLGAGRGDHLADQQLAGALLWSVGGLLAAVAGVALFASWLRGDSPAVLVRPQPNWREKSGL